VNKQSSSALVAAVGLSVVGLVSATIGIAYIAGLFGLSTAFASQIINAVQVGGWVLAVVMAAISGGIAGTVVATAKWAIVKFGEKAAIA